MGIVRKSGASLIQPAGLVRRSGASWANIGAILRRSGASWVTVWARLEATLSEHDQHANYDSEESRWYDDAQATATVTAGTGPFTYAWTKLSGYGDINLGASSATVNVGYGGTTRWVDITLQCVITDSISNTITKNITVHYTA